MNDVKIGSDVDPAKEERAGTVREVGGQAIWSLSSCKPGEQLSDYFCFQDIFYGLDD